MYYPEEFKRKCREAFPGDEELNKLLDQESRQIGEFLLFNTPTGVDFDIVINATSLEELKELAVKQKRIGELRKEWLKIDGAHRHRSPHS